jgi:site-specific recombinase XerC
MKPPSTLAVLLEGFFTQRLMNQKRASPHTLRSYRDTFRLLLRFAQQCLNKSPSCLAFEEIDAPLVTSFLDDLETSRGITARSRNLRLTAIRSFSAMPLMKNHPVPRKSNASWQCPANAIHVP